MFKILLKKQLSEIFRTFFYNPKNNKKRSIGGTIFTILLYFALTFGILGSTFAFFAISICESLCTANAGYLYFIIFGSIALFLGILGSVFNTYSSLYICKDNDLLLSMPIPVKYIIISRLSTVYLTGLMFSSMALLPTIIVYLCIAGFSFLNFVGVISFYLVISLIAFALSCLLGWLVAKISKKVKNKSFVSVAVSLAFLAAYYLVYFKSQELISNVIANAEFYGSSIKEKAYFLYLFGSIGEGNLISIGTYLLITIVVLTLCWLLLKNTFLSIAIASERNSAIGKERDLSKARNIDQTLLAKEFKKFTSSSTYMLNCGLGIIMLPILGVALLIKGDAFLNAFSTLPVKADVLVCAIFCAISSTIDVTVPSISLEGKSLWILQSLPIEPKKVFKSKTLLQFILSVIPLLLSLCFALLGIKLSFGASISIIVLAISYTLFSCLFSMYLAIMMPMLNWTNEVVPIKQSGSVGIDLLGSWGIVALFAVPYLFLGSLIPSWVYMLIWSVIFFIASLLIKHYLETKGSNRFMNL